MKRIVNNKGSDKLRKRDRQKDKALTNNQTPTETLFNEEVASELVDDDQQKRKMKKTAKRDD